MKSISQEATFSSFFFLSQSLYTIRLEFENLIEKPLIENSVLTYYYIFVDDTLLFSKKGQIQHDFNIFHFFVN